MIEEKTDPLTIFAEWFAEAKTRELNDPEAMALATVGPDGTPSQRMVLLKGYDGDGFVFYTNYESRKGRQLTAHPKAALLFHWKSLRRQVRLEGPIVQTMRPRPTPITPAGRAAARSAPGPPASRGRSPAASSWKSGSPASRCIFETPPCPISRSCMNRGSTPSTIPPSASAP